MTRRLTSCSSTSPSFWKTEPMCFSTARSLMKSVFAIVALLRPVAICCEHLALPVGQAQQRAVVPRRASSASTTFGSSTDPPRATSRSARTSSSTSVTRSLSR